MSLACPEFIGNFAPGLCRAVDDYCQLTGPGWDAEVMNTWSNGAFLLAAIAGWRLLSLNPQRQGAPDHPRPHAARRARRLGRLRFPPHRCALGEVGRDRAPGRLHAALCLAAAPALLPLAFPHRDPRAGPLCRRHLLARGEAPGSAPFGRALNLPTLVFFLLAAIGFLMRQREAFWPMFWALLVLLASSAASMADAHALPAAGPGPPRHGAPAGRAAALSPPAPRRPARAAALGLSPPRPSCALRRHPARSRTPACPAGCP